MSLFSEPSLMPRNPVSSSTPLHARFDVQRHPGRVRARAWTKRQRSSAADAVEIESL